MFSFGLRALHTKVPDILLLQVTHAKTIGSDFSRELDLSNTFINIRMRPLELIRVIRVLISITPSSNPYWIDSTDLTR